MMVLAIGLILLFVLDGLRMRGRLSALATIPRAVEPGAADGDQPGGELFVSVSGADLGDDVRVRVAAFAQREQLDVVDLIPQDVSTSRILAIAQLIDMADYRANPLTAGRTVGDAMLMSREVQERSGVTPTTEATPVQMVQIAERLKRYAARSTDLAVVDGMRATDEEIDARFEVTRETFHTGTTFVLALQLIIFVLIPLTIILPGAPRWGLGALAAYHLQAAIAILGTPVRPRDLWLVTLFRLPIDIYLWVRTVAGRWRLSAGPDPVEIRRPIYEELLADGEDHFFEPRRDDCPLCGATALSIRLRTRDLLQQKPGSFTLEECGSCGHIFQNPRLSIDGLDFYYKDFYDGLGERAMEMVFTSTADGYLARARMLRDRSDPKRWLDVGGGHGHFCVVARGEWPGTGFDGLDLSESIEEAERRRWIDRGYRGLFTELAPTFRGEYDVVSMGHYLEHTRDPIAEIEAARQALTPGGHLLIEVPDPESPLGRLLGRHWIPWFQPQHQHLVARDNLNGILKSRNFTPLQWDLGDAHQQVDFFFAAVILLDRIAPPPDRPWKPRAGLGPKVWRSLVWTLGTPLLLASRLADWMLAPLIRRAGMSNTYRVLARRNADS